VYGLLDQGQEDGNVYGGLDRGRGQQHGGSWEVSTMAWSLRWSTTMRARGRATTVRVFSLDSLLLRIKVATGVVMSPKPVAIVIRIYITPL
jgi:hypothetical protein